jgi:Holliday junction DNA helicase RuvA
VIGRLSGALVERAIDGTCIVDVGGVGYEVTVPLGTLGKLPADGERATLFVHTHVREDALVLYGFASLDDRAAFRTLLGVSSVGPKVSLAILSSLDARALATAIALGDRNAFKGITGVGKKIVERLLLELKDKMLVSASSPGSLSAPVVTAARTPARAPDDPLGVVSSALVQMGYKPAEAERAVARLAEREDVAGRAPAELLREALGLLR